MRTFNKILIANRGEIAVRIIRAAQQMGIQTVALFSKADSDAFHVRLADESYYLEGESIAETYLNVDKIIEIAQKSGSDAIHPGYGFLSENPKLVAACGNHQITFIGPNTRAIQLMGNKVESRNFVAQLGIPMTKGATGSLAELKKAASNIPLPILVKAAAGGGGKGMRIVHDLNDLDQIIESTSREALSYFGDSEVFIEQFIEDPRHIEIQVLGDKYGHVIHLYERECSIQRRYQKIIEESPSPTLNQEVRNAMGAAAVQIAKAIDYDSAGTLEFLVDKNLNFYFLEMNTRIQVEHPVTEMVTGVDLVMEQILIAAGNPLRLQQSQLKQSGHAIEARIYAEEPENNFRPAPGDITYYKEPLNQHIRIDSAIDSPTTIHSFYDPMISKLIAFGDRREIAIERLAQALNQYIIHGIKHNIPYLLELIHTKEFIENKISTKFCELNNDYIFKAIENRKKTLDLHQVIGGYVIYDIEFNRLGNKSSVWNQIGYWRNAPLFHVLVDNQKFEVQILSKTNTNYHLQIDGNSYCGQAKELSEHFIRIDLNAHGIKMYLSDAKELGTRLSYHGETYTLKRDDLLYLTDFFDASSDQAISDQIKSPMPGKLIKIDISEGDFVKKGERLLIVEAMKMENNILMPRDGIIKEIKAKIGEMVNSTSPLVIIEEEIQTT
jgi:3-methylcrotonyl-CoA carboxylase alpha subunit